MPLRGERWRRRGFGGLAPLASGPSALGAAFGRVAERGCSSLRGRRPAGPCGRGGCGGAPPALAGGIVRCRVEGAACRCAGRGGVGGASGGSPRLPAGLRPSARPLAASRSAAVRVCGGGGPRGRAGGADVGALPPPWPEASSAAGWRGRRAVARGEVASAGLRGARPACQRAFGPRRGLWPRRGARLFESAGEAARGAAAWAVVRALARARGWCCGLGCGSRSGSSSRLVLRLGLWFALWLALELEAGAAAWARARARAAALEAGAVARARAVVRAGAGAGARARAPRASRPPRAQFLLSLRQTAHGLQPAPPLGLACAPTFSDRRFSPLPR